MADSTLTLTFNQAKKTVVATGLIAIREKSIDVTVTGASALVADLVLKIQDKSNNGSTTPIGIVNSWTVSGANAVGTLNLDTSEAHAAFEESGNLSCKTFNLLLFTSTSNALQCNGLISVMNFPSSTTQDPTTLDQSAAIDALADRVTELEAGAITAVYQEDFEDVTALSSSATLKQTIAKVNAILAILKGEA